MKSRVRKAQGLDTIKIQEAGRQRNHQIKQLSTELDMVEQRRNRGLLTIPNLPHESVPVGTSSADNVEVRRHGTPPTFAFNPQPHWDLGPGSWDHRFRARHEDRWRAVLGLDRARARGSHGR